MKHKSIIKVIIGIALMVSGTFVMVACNGDISRPEVKEPLMPDLGPEGALGKIDIASVKTETVFEAAGGNQVYRIPAIITALDGSLIVFCENRHRSWRDKSYTDIVCKRSSDNGKSWSEEVNITASLNTGEEYAFMDPAPLVEPETGKIFLFFTRWKKLNPDVRNNRAFMSVSTDNGSSWSAPQDVTESLILEGMYSSGFGPGHGIAIKEGKTAGRLVVISRQNNSFSGGCYSIYSDDKGNSWKCGAAASIGEAQIAESGKDRLHLNIRRGASRHVSVSKDGGETWSSSSVDSSLPQISGGCEASVLGVGGNMVFYCGPQGGPASSGHDNRYGLKLFRSAVGAVLWSRSRVLYEKASGYSDLTVLKDGSLAIIFEAGPEKGFIKAENRGAGWMRLDLMILPAEIKDYGYWF